MTTTWSERVKPTTTWGERLEVETSWGARVKPEAYITPLQDAYTEVADENDEVIYIYADGWKLVPTTFWTPRATI